MFVYITPLTSNLNSQYPIGLWSVNY